MLPDAEIARIILGTPEIHTLITGITGEVLGNAQALAQEHNESSPGTNAEGTYLSSLYSDVSNGSHGEPVGEVGSTSPIALVVEFGTANRVTEGGADRGAMPAQHILQNAAQAAGLVVTPAKKK